MNEENRRGDEPRPLRAGDDRPSAEAHPLRATPAEKQTGRSIGALYRRMSGWYIIFSIAVFLFILFVGFQLARPLLPHLLGAGG